MNKVEKIINRTFDSRVIAMVITYIIDKGVSFCKEITDEQIEKLEGNGLMTEMFVKDLVRTARQVATECTIDEIWDCMYEIKLYSKANHIVIWRDDFSSDENFAEICEQADVEYDENCIDGLFIPTED